MATMVAINPYVIWTFFDSLLSFLLLSVLRGCYYGCATAKDKGKVKNKNKRSENHISEECVKSSGDGECRPDYGSGSDIIIVGAGVAGAALAHTLGKEGGRVHVIERDLTEPDRIVGELLLPGGYLKLIELGLEDCVEEIDAQRVLGYDVYKDGKNTTLSYPLEQVHSYVAGRCFHNGRFIQRMREKAAALPK